MAVDMEKIERAKRLLEELELNGDETARLAGQLMGDALKQAVVEGLGGVMEDG